MSFAENKSTPSILTTQVRPSGRVRRKTVGSSSCWIFLEILHLPFNCFFFEFICTVICHRWFNLTRFYCHVRCPFLFRAEKRPLLLRWDAVEHLMSTYHANVTRKGNTCIRYTFQVAVISWRHTLKMFVQEGMPSIVRMSIIQWCSISIQVQSPARTLTADCIWSANCRGIFHK